jgi:hypothetical protein
MNGAIPPLPQYAFMAWCSEHRDNFTFYLYFTFQMLWFVAERTGNEGKKV